MRRRSLLYRGLHIFGGLGLMAVGFPVLFIPTVPLGAILIVSGTLLILRVSPRARLFRRVFRRRFPKLAALYGAWECVLKGRWPRFAKPAGARAFGIKTPG